MVMWFYEMCTWHEFEASYHHDKRAESFCQSHSNMFLPNPACGSSPGLNQLLDLPLLQHAYMLFCSTYFSHSLLLLRLLIQPLCDPVIKQSHICCAFPLSAHVVSCVERPLSCPSPSHTPQNSPIALWVAVRLGIGRVLFFQEIWGQ